MSYDPIPAVARAARRKRRLGQKAACDHERCNEGDFRAVVAQGDHLTCYEHLAVAQGRSPIEAHHLAGEHNLPVTARIPGNDHRVLNDSQMDWPLDTLRNPDRSPLLKAAAAVRGWSDVMKLVIERVIGWIPGYLERLDVWLRRRIGPRWWEEFAKWEDSEQDR